MRLYYMVSGILLTLPVIKFSVAAPVLVREELQARINVVHKPEDVVTTLKKRGGELDELWLKLSGHPEGHSLSNLELPAAHPPSGPTNVEQTLRYIDGEPSQVSSQDYIPPSLSDESNKMWRNPIGGHFLTKPEEAPAAGPPSSLQLSGPTDVLANVGRPLLSIAKGPSLVAGPGHGLLNPDDELNKVWLDLFGHHFFEGSSATHLPLGSLSSGLADGSMAIEELPPSISKGPSAVSGFHRAPSPLRPGPDDELMKMWLKIIGYPESHSFANPGELSATHSPGSQPLGLVDESMAVKKPLPSISKEPFSGSSPHPVPLKPDDGLMKMWLNIIGYPEIHISTNTDKLSATLPSSSSQSSGLADGLMDVEKPLLSSPKEPSPVSSPISASLGDEVNKLRLLPDLFDHHSFVNPEESSAARPSWASLLSGQAHGWSEQPLLEQPPPVSSPDHALPSLGPLAESGYELMDWDASHLLSGPESSTMSSTGH